MKKQIAIFLLPALLLTLAACGKTEAPVTVQESGEFMPAEAASSAGAGPSETTGNGESCGSGVCWVYDGAGTLTLSGEGAMEDYTTLCAPWDLSGASISVTRLVVKPGVRYLGAYAFAGCCNLAEIVLPEGLSRIGQSAFADCIALQSVELPASLMTIETAAFSGCGLKSLTLPAGLLELGERAFNQCSAMTELRVPDTLCTVGEDAFAGCESLERVVLGEGAEAEPWFIQNGMDQLVEYDGAAHAPVSYSWSGESAGVAWHFEGGVLTVGGQGALPDYAVSGGAAAPWQALSVLTEKIAVETGITALGDYDFAGSCARVVTLPEGVSEIGSAAFSGCVGLTAVALPATVTDIGDLAFSGCLSLENITLPEGLRSIGAGTFELCSSLKELKLPASVESIGAGAFAFGTLDGTAPTVTASAGSYAENWLRENG